MSDPEKVYKHKVVLTANPVTGELPADDVVFDRMKEAGWTDDPLDGKSVMLDDGRELPNPIPIAPPIGFRAEPSIIDLINQQIANRAILLAGELEVDSPEDMEDFDLDDEPPEPRSVYELMPEEYPDLDKHIARQGGSDPGTASPIPAESGPVEVANPPPAPPVSDLPASQPLATPKDRPPGAKPRGP